MEYIDDKTAGEASHVLQEIREIKLPELERTVEYNCRSVLLLCHVNTNYYLKRKKKKRRRNL